MFGPDDAFLTTILKLLQQLPIYPMFGRGLTRLQPAYVEDVAEAIARALQGTETHAITYECGGPRVNPICRLARADMDLGDASESARHSESSGTDAARQRVLTGDARIWTAWNFAAHGRRDTPADVESIKELPRLIRSKIKLRALVNWFPLQLASGVARSKRAKSQGFSDASSLATRVHCDGYCLTLRTLCLQSATRWKATSDRSVASSPGTRPFRRARIVAGLPCG
jgi:hypothetical protein